MIENNLNIQMVDLKSQYLKIKNQVDSAINGVLENTQFINGEHVKGFQSELANYMGVKHVITCANGTDALQIAMMGLGLKPGDEVITPSFKVSCATVDILNATNRIHRIFFIINLNKFVTILINR